MSPNTRPQLPPDLRPTDSLGSRLPWRREEPAKALGIRGGCALDRVERCALAQVVAAHPEREAALAARDGAQPSNQHRVAALDVEWHRVPFRSIGRPELEARRGAESGLQLPASMNVGPRVIAPRCARWPVWSTDTNALGF